MADLTLDLFYGLEEDILAVLLKLERENMFGIIEDSGPASEKPDDFMKPAVRPAD